MKYAYFDKNNNNRILQWIDTSVMDYNLPDADMLHKCSEDEWALQFSGQIYMIQNGKVVPYVEPTVPLPSILFLREGKLADFKAKSDAITYAVRQEYPTDEVISWSKQESEARAYLADANAETPLLSAIAQQRGVSLALLAEKVVEKSATYAVFTGQIFGIRQALEDRLLAVDLDAPDAIDQINAIVWPEV